MAVSADKEDVSDDVKASCGHAGSLKRQQPETAAPTAAENSDTSNVSNAPKRQKSIPSAVPEKSQQENCCCQTTSGPAKEEHDQQTQPSYLNGCQQAEQAVQNIAECAAPEARASDELDEDRGSETWQQPAGVSVDELPSWCEHPLVLRQHYADDAQVEAFCYLPGHPLLALAAEGQAALLCKVLQQGGDPDAQDSRGYTALHLACWHAQLPSVRVLLEGGASLAVLDRAGRVAQELAAAAGHADVEAMLQQAAEVRQALLEQQRKQEWQQQQQHAGQSEEREEREQQQLDDDER